MPSIQELQQRAIEYAKSGDFGAQALSTNLELAKIAPTNEGALTRLSRCYMEGGQLDEATATLDAALQLNPQNTIASSLQLEVTKRRVASTPVVKTVRARARQHLLRRSASRGTRSPRSTAAIAGIGRAEFAALGQLSPEAAVEVARVADRAVADRAQRAAVCGQGRRRRATAPARVARGCFRRQHRALGGPGTPARVPSGSALGAAAHDRTSSHATPWGRDAVVRWHRIRLAPEGSENDQERALAELRAVSATPVRRVAGLSDELDVVHAGFIQYGDSPPAASLLPADALAWLIGCQHPATVGWIFFGRWLFLDRSQDAEILADGRKLLAWIDSSSRISCRCGRVSTGAGSRTRNRCEPRDAVPSA